MKLDLISERKEFIFSTLLISKSVWRFKNRSDVRGFRGSGDGMSKRVLDVTESAYMSTMSTVQ